MGTTEDKLIQQVADRLERLGTTPFAVERAANLPEDAVRSVLRGGKKGGTTINRAAAICEALGLELYIGPPVSREAIEDAAQRAAALSDTERLAAAISAVEMGLSQSKRKMKPAKKVEVILLAYELLGDLEVDAEEKIIRLVKTV
ncbi:hypothetical protein [uncultured Tateyamaria sp.]|uniref:hypothetical protein n=1 Tax=uncultured Tateyamaria sp. TaxID=455651 RepID=UPI00261C0351|nr:hypothetical protein [uncultured Tateyamaria sp.]